MGDRVAACVGSRKGQDKVRSLASAVLGPLQSVRGRLFPWVPVFLGIGIGLWFSQTAEPGVLAYGLAGTGFLMAAAGVWRGSELWQPMAVACAAALLGFLAAGFRAHDVQSPMLNFRYYGPIEGRIIEIDRSQADKPRLTLDQVVLDRVPPDRTPRKVRLSLHGPQPHLHAEPGQRVVLTGHLAPPEGPVEPGAFDFRRLAFFKQLGAVGYTKTPVLLLERPEGGTQLINRLRKTLAEGMLARMEGQPGAFATGAMTGEQSAISAETTQALRDSSLAHLLAISGMNLAFLIGFVFALIRYGIALVPSLALRVNAKKVAAVVSLGVAFFYLLLSGANVATERAFIMVAVMLGAILLDRRALTLRSVAIAGTLILLSRPETLLDPGFQMSFAATIALIAAFAQVDQQVLRERWPRWLIPVFTLVLSSVVAGFATAPYAAGSFNRFSDYGLLANLLTVPVFGVVIMPGGAIAALLAPMGLEGPALWAMQMASAWILAVAHWIAGLDGAVTAIPVPGVLVLPVLSLGALWLVIWPGRARFAGLLPMALALVLWTQSSRPEVLIDASGALVGVMGPEGRALSSPRGAGYAAENWLQRDGDLAGQTEAALRPGFAGAAGARSFRIGAHSGIALKGKGADVAWACTLAELVVVPERVESPPAGCTVIDLTVLEATGPLAINADGDGLDVKAVRSQSRIWSDRRNPLPDIAALVPVHRQLAGRDQ